MDETKKRHKNKHEWCWMLEFGPYFVYCELCHRCKPVHYITDKKYFTHKEAFIIVLEILKDHPSDCDCISCGDDERKVREYYKKYYKLE